MSLDDIIKKEKSFRRGGKGGRGGRQSDQGFRGGRGNVVPRFRKGAGIFKKGGRGGERGPRGGDRFPQGGRGEGPRNLRVGNKRFMDIGNVRNI